MNALLDETRTRRIDLGLPVLEQLRVSPTTYEVLAREKATDETWGQFAERGMIALSIMRRVSRMDLAGVSRLVVRLDGDAADEVVGHLTSVRLADDGQGATRKPLARSEAAPAADGKRPTTRTR